MRLGRVFIDISYVVDMDNEEMVSSAKESLIEDVMSMVKHNETVDNIQVEEDETLDEDDISGCLLPETEEDES
jgi:hypothetical protein